MSEEGGHPEIEPSVSELYTLIIHFTVYFYYFRRSRHHFRCNRRVGLSVRSTEERREISEFEIEWSLHWKVK